MTFIIRSMLPDGSKPAIGPSANKLGVRVAHPGKIDLPVDTSGNVHPRTGGMSVVPDWRILPPHRIPMRLNKIVRDAKGDNRLVCWRLGDLPFVDGPLSSELLLRVEGPTHGLMEPSMTVPLGVYSASLAATRELWEK